MTRYKTHKAQIDGYRMQIRRVMEAITRRDARLLGNHFSDQTMAFVVGTFVVSLVGGGFYVAGYFAPRADQGASSFIMTKSGGRYVLYDSDKTGLKWHEVRDLASARLILNKPELPKMVKDETLKSRPTGNPMGLLDGTDNLAVRGDDTTKWTVCDRTSDAAELSLTKADSRTTTLFAGADSLTSAVTALPANDAMLIKLDDNPQEWIVYNGVRALVGPQDQATRQALHLTPEVSAKAIAVSKGLFNAIPAAPALTAPFIADRGRVNPALPQTLNGDVIETAAADGTRQYFIPQQNGVQQVSEFTAQLLINTGSKEITTLARAQLSAVPLVSDIDNRFYPAVAPTFRQPHVLCWSWSKGSQDLKATATVMTGEALPVAPDKAQNVVELLRSTNPEATANAAYTAPGEGWFVRITGATAESHAQEQLFLITAKGVRYFIGPDEQNKYDSTVKALGIGAKDPLPIPWPIAELYSPGPTFSHLAASVELSPLVPPNVNQKAVPLDPNVVTPSSEAPPPPPQEN
ncbi:type VII secretion protein EccB, Actinobacterial [Mycobacteroides abscessus subsp. abscessus]|uniref:type VII secretion protein EccB n=1 Tax=Mycobacteroides abscessus TaxID=36809 RepID=UPI000925BA0B|nr:type VII secretion protein EccB [Mycobacteroides abscessus]SIH21625.1 type VII secretion protein EccB, Actinobacterial [Mycobacteroides abscessus subsp. abscessus]